MTRTVAAQRFSGGTVFELVHGDLTEQAVEAIVNAANEQLQHGGGVAAAIAHKGGPVVQEESRQWIQAHGPINHDEPALTGAGKLPCQVVIHAVGPRWGEGEEADKLRRAVTSALQLACSQNYNSLALPPISTGIFGYPKDQAAEVILDAVETFCRDQPDRPLRQIRLTIIDEGTLAPFQRAFETRWPASTGE